MSEDHRDATVLGMPDMVRLDLPVPIEVFAQGEWWPGVATTYRGKRVSCRWTKGPAQNYLTWEPAEKVRRVGDGAEGVRS